MIKALKQWCEKCECLVVVEGHEERCRPVSSTAKVWSERSRLAWFGDSIQRMDVQLALVMMGVPDRQLGETMRKFTDGTAMLDYMVGLGVDVKGRSVHSVASEFEAQYCDAFRVAYLREKFPDVADKVLSLWQPPVVGDNWCGLLQ